MGPPSQITPTGYKEKPPAPTKTILISQQPQNPNQNQEKPVVADSFRRTYHHQDELHSPACINPVLSAHWSRATIYSATFFREVSLPNKDGRPQERYPILCVCHCLAAKSFPILHTTSSALFSLLSADLHGNKHIYIQLFRHSRREKIFQDTKLQTALHAKQPQNNSVTFSETAFLPVLQFGLLFLSKLKKKKLIGNLQVSETLTKDHIKTY